MEVKYVSEPLYRMSWEEVEDICRSSAGSGTELLP